MTAPDARRLVVVGHGMVGQRMVEKARAHGWTGPITVIGDEPRHAYDRVRLTSYLEHYQPDQLLLKEATWFEDNNVSVVRNDVVTTIDTAEKHVATASGLSVPYDDLVLATGSYAWCPPIPGKDTEGVFVYRTICDLDKMTAYIKEHNVQRAAVIGGGLLGLEACMACRDMGMQVTAIDQGEYFMSRQLDKTGGEILVNKIREMGSEAVLGVMTKQILSDEATGRVSGLRMSKHGSGDDFEVEAQLVIIATGIRPRDELARSCDDIEVHARGGVVVDDHLRTTCRGVYAIGEVALHRDICYGIVAPGYDMAEVVAHNLMCADSTEHKTFEKGDMNTKLKLVGVDVASFGDYQPGSETEEAEAKPEAERTTRTLKYHDPFSGVYRKLVFNREGTHLLGGMLVGDASDYAQLTMLSKSTKPLKVSPFELLAPPSTRGASSAAGGVEDMDDDAQVCSCNDVSKGAIAAAFTENGCDTLEKVGQCTGAGTGCGGCKPLVKQILDAELEKAGIEVTNYICPHFDFSRAELFHIVKVKQLKTFESVIESHGNAGVPQSGCATCKAAIASILASLWNEHVMSPDLFPLQNSNDRFLSNIQKGGTYSVVPRIPGGEVTPDGLMAIASVAKKYKLYTKITGGQRIDLFGAKLEDLPKIWKQLTDAGFESGHAYGKSLRTVKSCVGNTFCRYGMQNTTAMAIRLEERYKGIRSPHKLKGGVSACARDCAEANSKDFALIATEHGFNVYVCGNGGTRPRHATLLASDVAEDLVIKYLDRFIMFYISTADKLQRTARWLENLEGGIDYLREVIIDDKLGICDELERQIAFLVDTFECEWTRVVNDPELQKLFRPFANAEPEDDETLGMEYIEERDQLRPADWPKDRAALPRLDIALEPAAADNASESGLDEESKSSVSTDDGLMANADWVELCSVKDVPKNSGVAVKYGSCQLAIFNFTSRNSWYATQNMCPNKNSFLLARGTLEETKNDTPCVLEPLHSVPYNLNTGVAMNGTGLRIRVFPVKIENGQISLLLPPKPELERILDTRSLMVKATTAASRPLDGVTSANQLDW